MTNEHEDKRQAPRAPIELRVDYQRMNTFFADYTRNISRGGTFVRTQKPLPVGTVFRFRLAIPARSTPFDLRGEVTWSRTDGDDAGMGIRFVHDDDASRRAFEAEVEKLLAESLGPHVAAKLLEKK